MKAHTKGLLEELYARYNRRELVHPDPLEFLYAYDDIRDREVAGLVASSLAYGRVAGILASVSHVLNLMGPSPSCFLERATRRSLEQTFASFKHRWTTGEDIASLLFAAKHTIERYGSLYECFAFALNENDDTILPALSAFVKELSAECNGMHKSFLPSPDAGSACKRLNLFLRWMVRNDDVDPGGWDNVPASRLIVPLDTHMLKISLALKLTKRNGANMRTANEITEAFRAIAPRDPVRYDFALTRLGIRKDADIGAFLEECAEAERTLTSTR